MMNRIRIGAGLALACAAMTLTPVMAQEGEPPIADFSDHAIALIDIDSLELLDRLERDAITLSCRAGFGEQLVVVDRALLEELEKEGVEFTRVEPDAQAWIDRTAAERQTIRAQRGAGFFDVYRTYDEISTFCDGIVAANPAVATRISVGTSLGDQPLALPGKDIFAVRITAPPVMGEPERPVVVINGCQHAREWISPMSVTFCVQEFAQGYGVDQRITDILDKVEIHFIPVVNPNGYDYTFTSNRFWRKNRRSNGVGGVGVDLNRNWPTAWNNGQSTSTNGGNDLYVGPAPLSEPESALVAAYIENLAGTAQCLDGCGSGCCPIGTSTSRVKGHLDVHSFSQVILGPWSFTASFGPPAVRVPELELVQQAMSDAMFAVAGAPYPAALGDMPILSPAGGVMPDWTFAEIGALSWTLEMRPQTSGMGGFELPVDQIDEGIAELFAAVIELAEHATLRLGLELAAPAPASAPELATIELDLAVTAFNGNSIMPGSVLARSRTGSSGMFAVTPMSFDGTDYDVALATPACGETLEYYFEATTDDGVTITLPADAPTTVFTTESAIQTTTFDDDYESDTGWAIDADGDDTATTGIWERAVPQATTAQPGADFSDDGTLCYVTGADASGGLGGDDIDGGDTTLQSPLFDLSGATGATVSYVRWFSNDEGGNPSEDALIVEISDDDGASWVRLERVGPAGAEASGGWFAVAYRVEDFVGLTSTVRVRFNASDLINGSVVEAAIDEFVILTDDECPVTNTCAADFDMDGDVDLTDFGTFGAAFGSMTGDANYDADADFDSDGDVDLTDFGSFGTEFGRTDC